MRMSELQDKDIINLTDGKNVGKIIDAILDEDGNIKAFIIQRTKLFNIIPSSSELEVKWNQIKTIGSDVILIDIKNLK